MYATNKYAGSCIINEKVTGWMYKLEAIQKSYHSLLLWSIKNCIFKTNSQEKSRQRILAVIRASKSTSTTVSHTKGFPHVLVEVDGICVLHELSNHLPLVILHHQYFLRLGHPTYHQQTHLSQEINTCQHVHTHRRTASLLSHITVCSLCGRKC